MGLGTQDDFAYAQEFISAIDVDGSQITFLWDPSFVTWRSFGVRFNSSMAILSADLREVSNVFFGFDEDQQAQVLQSAQTLS